ncbi:hypothetical protein HMPREF3213_02901 [Heyndrickxia coagulans]|uniref:Uncharacterized protein n=1 Tax=Heyndrickxia coagulans TaxID=1398 RepID=A0A133KGR9_HEYCO|nr:hypothetical protein HMPREF3213_02901 [Heyndrickxia coagulans]
MPNSNEKNRCIFRKALKKGMFYFIQEIGCKKTGKHYEWCSPASFSFFRDFFGSFIFWQRFLRHTSREKQQNLTKFSVFYANFPLYLYAKAFYCQ